MDHRDFGPVMTVVEKRQVFESSPPNLSPARRSGIPKIFELHYFLQKISV
jgi:hypothetical protein